MRTVEEFIEIVIEEDNKYNEELSKLAPATLIDRAFEIAKWQSIYDYIMGKVAPYSKYEEGVFKDFTTLEIYNPIATIWEYESLYNEPMWATWDGLDDVICNLVKEIKNQNN